MAVALAVSAIVMGGMNQRMTTQGTGANRGEMHTSARDATEVLEQEIGQAGKISLPAPPRGTPTWRMLTPVFVPGTTPVTQAGVVFSCRAITLLHHEQLLLGHGAHKETRSTTRGAT